MGKNNRIDFACRLGAGCDGDESVVSGGKGGQGDSTERETTEMGGHLGDDVENQCTGNSLEPVTVTLERTPSNGGYEA